MTQWPPPWAAPVATIRLKNASISDALDDVNAPDKVPPVIRLISARRRLIIGHRGFRAIAPENTLPSFLLAMKADSDLIELDYRHSKDGVPVVIHDDTPDRTTDARKRWGRSRIKVADTTATELQCLDAGSWFGASFAGTKVPLLVEALDTIHNAGGVALIEHKSGDPETCVRILRDRKLINRVIIISFDWDYLRAFHELEPRQALGALGPPARLADGRKTSGISKKFGAAWFDEASRTGARIIVWNRNVSAASVKRAHRRGWKVWVYTVNTLKLAHRLLAAGVDGIITDDPAMMRRHLTA